MPIIVAGYFNFEKKNNLWRMAIDIMISAPLHQKMIGMIPTLVIIFDIIEFLKVRDLLCCSALEVISC